MRKDTTKIKSDILQFLTDNGPSLPVQISRYIKVDTLFTSAFLSELLGQQKIKMSNMRVGSSSVYFIPGTESGLEKYSEYLKSKEKEAFNILKTHSFLEDEIEHPAIRVALREIKDFAIAFTRNNRLIWRYFLVSENDYNDSEETQKEIRESPKEKIEEKKENVKEEVIKEKSKEIGKIETKDINSNSKIPGGREIKKAEEKKDGEIKTENVKTESKELERIIPKKETEEKPLFANPLATKIETKKPKEKVRSEFCLKTMEFILDNKWKIIKEISHKLKEYNCLTQIQTDLGPMIFLTIAKDKKSVTQTDMTKILGEAQAIPLPALILSTGDIQKKAQAFLEKFSSVLKVKKIN